MEFSVVPSKKDGKFDPVAQFQWNLDHGFEPVGYLRLLKNSSEESVAERNAMVYDAMSEVEASILDLIENPDGDRDAFEVNCEAAGHALAGVAIFDENSSEAIISVIEALIKLEFLGEVEDYQETIWSECLDKVIASPACPRPVLWRIVDEIRDGAGFNLEGPESGSRSSGVFYSLLKNPVLGDQLILQDVIAEGNLDLLINPSMTFKSLEKIYPGIMFYEYGRMVPIETAIEKALGRFLKEAPLALLKGLPNFRGNPDLVLSTDSGCMGDLVLLAIRLEFEIRLGRSKLADFVKSKNAHIAWMGKLWSAKSESDRDAFVEASPLVKLHKRGINSLASIHTM